MKRVLVLSMALLIGLAPFAFTQTEGKGNIYGTVTDASAGVLPGVMVTISGDFGTNTSVTDASGKFRFLNMDHGRYTITVELTGFTTQARNIVLGTGVNVDLQFVMDISGVEETVTVTAETPVVDVRKMGTETVVNAEELENIPTSREPWALMRSVGGIQVDRVNLAGSESGQQSNFQGKGADDRNNVWILDGLPITDVTSMSSPSYYTYDVFDEINITTGGTDITNAYGGVQVGMVTKRGSNTPMGSFNYNIADDSLQSSNLPPELEGDPRLQGNDKADHTDRITDWSIEGGGPLLKDRLWAYGNFGKNVIDVLLLTQTRDLTTLKNYTGKVNFQMTDADQISFFYFYGAKVKIGRGGGTPPGLAEADEHLWDQGGAFPREPRGLVKGEWNRVWSPGFISNIKAAYNSVGFTLASRTDKDEVYDYVTSNTRGHAQYDYRSLRPNTTIKGDSSYFAEGWGGSHEVKFGIGWKKAQNNTASVNPGNKMRVYFNSTGSDEARFWRDALSINDANYWSAYVGDTFTKDRMTFMAGLRFDRQTSVNAPSTAEGNPLVPELLPSLVFPGGGQGIKWTNFSPRVGFTYALDEDFKTVLRASFSRYHGQLPAGQSGQDSPLGGRAYLQYNWQDLNGDEAVQVEEVDFSQLNDSSGVDPNDPGALGESVDKIDPDFGADIDYEVVVGVDHELVTDLGVGGAFTWRNSYNVWQGRGGSFTPRIGVTFDDYYLSDPVTVNGFTSTPYILKDGVTDRPDVTGGSLLTNRDDYHRNFKGFEIYLNKRLSNKWMSRAVFSWGSWTEHFDGPNGYYPNRTSLVTEPQIDGGKIIQSGGGSGKTAYYTYGWQFNLSGLYQLPYDFDIAGNLFTRQGYPLPLYQQIQLGAVDGNSSVLVVDDVYEQSLSSLMNVDLRIAKRFMFGSRRGITLGMDIFNVFNSNTVLNRVVNVGSSSYPRIDEILAPRIIRFNAKINF